MMPMPDPRRARKAVGVYQSALMTVPPLQAVVMLYDRVLAHLHGASAALRSGDYPRQLEESMRAVEILRGLLSVLDTARGGEVAYRLGETYRSNMTAILSSLGSADAETCYDRISRGLRALRNAWADVAGVPAIVLKNTASPVSPSVEQGTAEVK